MKRRLRYILAYFLPEFIKAPFRARLYGHFQPRTTFPLSFKQEQNSLVASINDKLSLRVTEQERSDLRYELVENGACVEEMSGFLQMTGNSKVLFDVGAYKGLFSLLFCLKGNDKRSFAYEPSPPLIDRARLLGEMNQLSGQIEWRQQAVGNVAKLETFILVGADFASQTATGQTGDIEVQMVTLDEECERLNIWPDVLKVDIEGFELEALQGASKLLARHRPKVFLELHLDLLERRQVKAKDVTDCLEAARYRFFTSLGRPLSARAVYDSPQAVLRCMAQPIV